MQGEQALPKEMEQEYKGYLPSLKMFSPWIDFGDSDLGHVDIEEFAQRVSWR